MRIELESLLDRVTDYQDRPFEWAEAWAFASEMMTTPCYRGGTMISWQNWLKEVSKVGKRPGLTIEMIKQSALDAMMGRSVPDLDFGVEIRYAAWWNHKWGIKGYRAMCQELVNLHSEYNLGCEGFESYDQWLAELLKEAPPREVSL